MCIVTELKEIICRLYNIEILLGEVIGEVKEFKKVQEFKRQEVRLFEGGSGIWGLKCKR